MMIQYLKKSSLTTFLLMFGLVHTGCALHSTSPTNEKDLYEIREQNLKEDITSIRDIRDMALVDSVASTDQTGPVIGGPLTLADAIAYSIEYNLDAAVLKLEREIRQEASTGAKLRMLPSLTMEGKFSRRNNYSASYSEPLFPGDPISKSNDLYEYSRDKSNRGYSLELSWDLVDFGISYFQHMQARNRVWIAEQRHRRMIQNLKLDVTKAFWRVQVAKAAKQMSGELIGHLQERERILQDQLESRMVSEIEVLETTTALSEMRVKMTSFGRELRKYKLQLASLMGSGGRADFEVAEADFDSPIEKMDVNLKELEKVALRNRPELVEQDLEELIAVDDARIAVSKMAPNPEVFWRYNYDSDSHLYYDQWKDIGVNVSIDLLSIPQKLSRIREVKKKKRLIRKRRLSVAVAILTQLNIAAVDYENGIRKYEEMKEVEAKRKQLMEARRRYVLFGKGRIKDLLESEAKHLFSQVRTRSLYGEVMIGKERILNTFGCDDPERVPPLQICETTPDPVAKAGDIAPSLKMSLSSETKAFLDKRQTDVLNGRLDENNDRSDLFQTPDTGHATVNPSISIKPGEDHMPDIGPADDTSDSFVSRDVIGLSTFNAGEISVIDENALGEMVSKRDMEDADSTVKPEANTMAQDEFSTEPEEDHVPGIGPTDDTSDTFARSDVIDLGIPADSTVSVIDEDALGDTISTFPYSIHLSSHQTLEETQEVVSYHRRNGLFPYAFKFSLGKKGAWWRVYIGCYKTRDEAVNAKEGLGLEGATVWETPFANLIGTYSSESAMQDMSRKLEQQGHFPYAIKAENDMFRLLTGAFSIEKRAERQKEKLQSRGIEAHVILRTNGTSDTLVSSDVIDSGTSADSVVSVIDEDALGEMVSTFPYSIHLSSYQTLEETQKELSYHRRNGLFPYAFKVNLGEKGVWWRIYIGCYKTRDEAVNAKTGLGLEEATVWETPFANLIGTYSTERDLQEMSRKLEQLGHFPYAIKAENKMFRLLIGTFSIEKRAEQQKEALQSQGIEACVVLR